MGEQAVRLFEEARRVAGLFGTIRLASLARITSGEAPGIEDSKDAIKRLEDGLAQIRQDEANRAHKKSEVVATGASTVEQTRLLRKHILTFVELISQRDMVLDDVNETAKRVTEMASAVLDVERVSVWLLDAKNTKITCANLWERNHRRHSAGAELAAKDFQPYFAALIEERTIAAHDAHKDPRTSCFANDYLAPRGITSMLDVPIWIREKLVGVVCHEHIGQKRRWDGDEENFAYLMANFMALALERAKR